MKKKSFDDTIWIPPGGGNTVLLHACCAPCSGAIVEAMLAHGLTPVIYYCNPNIYPRSEYEKRRGECRRYALEMGVEMVEDRYDHEEWSNFVAGLEAEPERGARCLRCFEIRLSRAASYASEHGIHSLATTLGSSRWKNLDQIGCAGDMACNPFNDVIFWNRNWRKSGLQERRNEIIRERGFYNQLYCGCEFSMKYLAK